MAKRVSTDMNNHLLRLMGIPDDKFEQAMRIQKSVRQAHAGIWLGGCYYREVESGKGKKKGRRWLELVACIA
jgi:hypothetical protein